MKRLEVVAAAILSDGKVLAVQRGYGAYKDFWEFPGGKVEAGESLEQALRREIFEELNVAVAVGDLAGKIDYDYPEFHVAMHCFFCAIESGELKFLEHEDYRWLEKSNLYGLKWLPSDLALLEKISARLN